MFRGTVELLKFQNFLNTGIPVRIRASPGSIFAIRHGLVLDLLGVRRHLNHYCMLERIPYLRKSLFGLLAVPMLLFLLGCPSSDLSPVGEGQGRVLRIDTVHTMITLDHNRIPAMMQSLVMSYPVSNPGLFNGLSVGDSVAFALHSLGSGKYMVTAIKKVKAKP